MKTLIILSVLALPAIGRAQMSTWPGPGHVLFGGTDSERYFVSQQHTRAGDSERLWWIVVDSIQGYDEALLDSEFSYHAIVPRLRHDFITRYGVPWKGDLSAYSGPNHDSVTYLLYHGHNAQPIMR